MPITDAHQGIGFEPGFVHQTVAYFRRKNVFVDLHIHGFHCVGERNSSTVFQPDPHEIDGDDDTVVTSLYHTHQPKIEIRQNVASRDTHASFMAKRPHGSVNTWEPQIRH